MWFNPIVCWLLRSPFHWLMSRSIMLMSYTRRRSGRTYVTPMNYVQVGGSFYTTSPRTRTWWRNLRGGCVVGLRVQGRELSAQSEVAEDVTLVAHELITYFDIAPQFARFYGVKHDSNGKIDVANVFELANKMVVVKSKVVDR